MSSLALYALRLVRFNLAGLQYHCYERGIVRLAERTFELYPVCVASITAVYTEPHVLFWLRLRAVPDGIGRKSDSYINLD